MQKIGIVLALVFMGASVIAEAQHGGGHHGQPGSGRPDRPGPGFPGSHCRPGVHCPPPVDPSPYDPNPYIPAPVEPPPYDPNYGGQPDYQGDIRYGSVREIYFGRRASNEHIDLLQLAGINAWSDRGLTIDSVEVRGQMGSVQASLELNADGFVLDRNQWPANNTLLRPNRSLVVGQTFNQLTLGVFGTMYIDRIILRVRLGYNPPQPPPPVQNTYTDAYIGQTFYQLTTLDLKRLTNLQNYRGYRVIAVTVWGRNLDSRGSARVVINGQTAGRIDLRNGGERLYMPIQATVGYDLSGLNLLVAPTSTIDSVRIELAR